MWKSVPKEQDYLAASVKCILQFSKRFPEPNACSKLGPALFWQPSCDIPPFADCSHDRRSPCHRTQELIRTCIRPQAAPISRNRARLSSGTAVRSYRSGHTNLTWNNNRYHQQFSSQRARPVARTLSNIDFSKLRQTVRLTVGVL